MEGFLLVWLSGREIIPRIPLSNFPHCPPTPRQWISCCWASYHSNPFRILLARKEEMPLGVLSKTSASLAFSRSRERHGRGCAILVLHIFFSKKKKKQPEESQKFGNRIWVLFQDGIFNISACINCSMQSQTGISRRLPWQSDYEGSVLPAQSTLMQMGSIPGQRTWTPLAVWLGQKFLKRWGSMGMGLSSLKKKKKKESPACKKILLDKVPQEILLLRPASLLLLSFIIVVLQ